MILANAAKYADMYALASSALSDFWNIVPSGFQDACPCDEADRQEHRILKRLEDALIDTKTWFCDPPEEEAQEDGD